MNTDLLIKPTNGKPLGFYTPDEASRIARVPQWTVNSWRRHCTLAMLCLVAGALAKARSHQLEELRDCARRIP